MPKLPSPNRVPEQHLLSHDALAAEAEERAFQRHVNRHNYLSWYALVRKVNPERRYELKTFGFKYETLSGQQVLDQIRPIFDARGCTFVDSVTTVPDDYETPVEKLWMTFTDEHGNTVVANENEDVWDHDTLTQTMTEEAEIITEAYSNKLIGRVVDLVIQRRLEGHERTPDFDEVRALTRLAVINGLTMFAKAGMPPENAVTVTAERASEAFDRVFHAARIKAAGINIDEHPEYRSYQKFFEIGMPPPTHAQMADVIIDTFGKEPATPGTEPQQTP